MGLVLRPPAPLDLAPGEQTLFLAGSIEMGTAALWQEEVERAFASLPVTILNPRRLDWDSSWRQSADDTRFREQVVWELSALEQATQIVLYLDPATRAPVSLLEMGLFARSGRLIVCCPEGYFRKGNVDIVCSRYNIRVAATLAELIETARAAFVPYSR